MSGVSDDRKKATLAEAAHRSFGIADQDAPLGGSGLAGLTGTADITSNSAGLIGLGLRFSTRNAFTALPIILK